MKTINRRTICINATKSNQMTNTELTEFDLDWALMGGGVVRLADVKAEYILRLTRNLGAYGYFAVINNTDPFLATRSYSHLRMATRAECFEAGIEYVPKYSELEVEFAKTILEDHIDEFADSSYHHHHACNFCGRWSRMLSELDHTPNCITHKAQKVIDWVEMEQIK